MGFVAVPIFWFAVVFVGADGVEDYFAPAFAYQEDCEHFAGHLREWVEQSGGEIVHWQDCTQAEVYFKDDSV